MKNIKPFLIIGGGLIFAFFALVFLILSGQVYQYDSVAFGNWAMWFGAIGTIGTLVLLMIQNYNLSKHQKNTEELQSALWEKQLKALNFKEYQSHISEFNDTLISIEKTFSGSFLFHDKKAFYKSIFTENNRNNIQYELGYLQPSHRLEQIQLSLEECLTSLITEHTPEKSNPYEVFISYVKLLDKFRLKTPSNSQFGDVTSMEVTINIFQSPDQFMSLYSGYNKIRSFCQLENYNTPQNENLNFGLITENLLHFYASDPNSQTITVNFGHFDLLKVLSASIKITKEYGLNTAGIIKLVNIYGFIRGTTIPDTDNQNDVREYLVKLADAFITCGITSTEIAEHISNLQVKINS
ncbi:hypothetical protein HWV00_15685 [Moritella sp. 24]|uniref:hypothetical protein n=1 Tax=Moritella sp. 24 TaxID=2746230 RepID=UPI001BAC22B3|nr:hypothetical protein [Moritella sp. 24]QUM77537.1 hypothetical protein HWV00_15685 [Moritella sp. 24]